jgi:rhodanese-related sulfurtransferase
VHAPRTVTEWRVDPASGGHDPAFDSFERLVVVVCSQGYSSRLAAANLRRVGYFRGTDLVGGFEAWHRAGLAVERPTLATGSR